MPLPASDWAAISPTNNSAAGGMASAATIAPSTFLTVLSGAVAVTTITPPVTHTHMLALAFPGTAGVATGGNIAATKASVANEVMLLVYNPTTQKYHPVGQLDTDGWGLHTTPCGVSNQYSIVVAPLKVKADLEHHGYGIQGAKPYHHLMAEEAR